MHHGGLTTRNAHNSLPFRKKRQDLNGFDIFQVSYIIASEYYKYCCCYGTPFCITNFRYMCRSVCSNSTEFGSFVPRKCRYGDRVAILLVWEQDSKYFGFYWLPSRINNFRLCRTVLAIVPMSWDVENMGIKPLKLLCMLSITEVEIGCQLLMPYMRKQINCEYSAIIIISVTVHFVKLQVTEYYITI